MGTPDCIIESNGQHILVDIKSIKPFSLNAFGIGRIPRKLKKKMAKLDGWELHEQYAKMLDKMKRDLIKQQCNSRLLRKGQQNKKIKITYLTTK